jgi:drug/metabolite transporter (DMT)-like permease
MAGLAAALGVLSWPNSWSPGRARSAVPEGGAGETELADRNGGADGERGALRLALAAGVFDAGGNVFYLLAVRADLLALVAAIQSLYPAATVSLAGALQGERPQRIQWVGMALAMLAVVLVVAG